MEPETASGIRTWQWVVTVIVVIVLIVIGVMVFGNKGAQAPTVAPAETANNSQTGAPSASGIVMSDQYPGNVVYLSSVQMSAPGWVVIHKDNAGQPGDAIGETYFNAGINPGKVTLTEPMIDGGTYYAVLNSDDGNKKFDATTDLPMKDGNGNVIMHVFHASSSAGANLKG